MSEEVVKGLISGVVTLAVGFALFQLQQGGRRRRLRRDIREELELLDLLDNYPEARTRVREHVETLLSEYTPPPDAPPAGSPISARGAATIAFVSLVAVILGLVFFPGLTTLEAITLGVAFTLLGNFLAAMATWAERMRLQHERVKAKGAQP